MNYLDFTEMPVWQKGFKLLIEIYKGSKGFPDNEKFGLISDTSRAVNSLVHKLAEEFGRFERLDMTRYY
jgi:four helix bundle protein